MVFKIVFLYETYAKYIRNMAETFSPDESFKITIEQIHIFIGQNISNIGFGKKYIFYINKWLGNSSWFTRDSQLECRNSLSEIK